MSDSYSRQQYDYIGYDNGNRANEKYQMPDGTVIQGTMWNKSAIKYFDGSGKKQLIAVLLLVSGLYFAYRKVLLKK
mgnify:CR=1 FL=1